jgi:DNA helicase-2/ATP-dependent DNA helicase PcrA
VVFVTGWEDGTFPHMRSLADPDQLEEERRLAYVGLTRARQRLYISRAAVRTAWGVPNEFPASRFLDDVPEELVDWRRRESSMAVLRAGGSGWGGGASAWGGRGSGSGSSSGYRPGGAPGSRSGPVKTTKALPSTGATFGSATPRPAGDVPSLSIGDKVTHDAYGVGTVVAVEGAGQNAVAKIDFGADGTKRLLLRYSPVTKL